MTDAGETTISKDIERTRAYPGRIAICSYATAAEPLWPEGRVSNPPLLKCNGLCISTGCFYAEASEPVVQSLIILETEKSGSFGFVAVRDLHGPIEVVS